jgi:hypothetical protein
LFIVEAWVYWNIWIGKSSKYLCGLYIYHQDITSWRMSSVIHYRFASYTAATTLKSRKQQNIFCFLKQLGILSFLLKDIVLGSTRLRLLCLLGWVTSWSLAVMKFSLSFCLKILPVSFSLSIGWKNYITECLLSWVVTVQVWDDLLDLTHASRRHPPTYVVFLIIMGFSVHVLFIGHQMAVEAT